VAPETEKPVETQNRSPLNRLAPGRRVGTDRFRLASTSTTAKLPAEEPSTTVSARPISRVLTNRPIIQIQTVATSSESPAKLDVSRFRPRNRPGVTSTTTTSAPVEVVTEAAVEVTKAPVVVEVTTTSAPSVGETENSTEEVSAVTDIIGTHTDDPLGDFGSRLD